MSATAVGGVSKGVRIRAILAGCAGNLVEWFDWFAYSSFALYFAKHFFPQGDQTAQLLQTAAVFAIGFLVRPLGAWVMGLYADRVGRRAALTWSVALMCAGSFAIALMPDYSVIGAAAPIGLVIARLVQGLSLGGEYGASAVYMSEMAERKRRGFWSSFHVVSVMTGQLMALVVLIVLQNTLPPGALEDWGWRIPFAIGGFLAVLVFWIRLGAEESTSFEAARLSGAPVATTAMLIARYPKEAMAVFVLTSAGALPFYAYTSYMLTFLNNTAGFTKEAAATISAASLVVFMLIQPIFGALSDRYGRRPILVFGFATGALFTYPLMMQIAGSTSALTAFALICGLMVILTGYTSVNALFKAELFPAHIRALGVSLPYAVANATLGGTAQYLALWWKKEGHESWFFIYISICMAIAAVVALRLRDTGKTSLIAED